MIQDQQLMKGVCSILQRTERQRHLSKIVDTFVDVGVLAQLNNRNNQIMYGRRGTGKTHILKVLNSQLIEDNNNAVAFIDARLLGSTSQFSDSTIPLKQRCLALFRDMLGEIYNVLLNQIVHEKPKGLALESLHRLSQVMTENVSYFNADKVVSRTLKKSVDESTAGFTINPTKGIDFELSDRDNREIENESTTSYSVMQADKLIFPALHETLTEVLKIAGVSLYILLDEWSSIPFELQPYLAEFLKRSFFPNSQVVVKIASLEYRSNFGIKLETGSLLGFELGSDIPTALDIDDYYVYDRNPTRISDAFAELLYRHIKSELPDSYLEIYLGIKGWISLNSRLFTGREVFSELVRASEGVARDLINIFSQAYLEAHRRGRETIDKKAILEASHQWYEKDKAKNLDDETRRILGRIISEVIGHRHARSFRVPVELEKHQTIQKLFDSRVLHLKERGYADKNNPGNTYNIYSLDYATYVKYIKGTKQIQMEFDQTEELFPDDFVVPFDDKRSIRRTELNKDLLK